MLRVVSDDDLARATNAASVIVFWKQKFIIKEDSAEDLDRAINVASVMVLFEQ